MTNKEDIKDELIKTALIFSDIENINVYAVPLNYFETFADEILQKINSGAEPLYYFPNNNPFEVPLGYFDQLADDVLQNVKSTSNKESVFEELENVAPFLNTLNKEPVFTIPTDYFDKLDTSKQGLKKPGKVFDFHFHWIYKFAVAAVFTALIGIGLFIILGKQNLSLKANNTTPVEIRTLSEEDITDFLSTNISNDETIPAQHSSTVQNNDIHNAVKEISDDDIKQFLQESEAQEGI